MTLFQKKQLVIKLTAAGLIAEPFTVRRIADKDAVFSVKIQFLKRKQLQTDRVIVQSGLNNMPFCQFKRLRIEI